MLMNFRYKFMQFMQGRYGVDATFFVLFGFSCILATVNIFLKLWFLTVIVYLINFYAIYRFFSRNISFRLKENKFVTGWFFALMNRYKTYKTRKADKTHIYKKCPGCKAVLRLPRRKGKHTTLCTACSKQFEVIVRK